MLPSLSVRMLARARHEGETGSAIPQPWPEGKKSKVKFGILLHYCSQDASILH